MELRMIHEERDRLKVMAQLKAKKLKQDEAPAPLRISERQVRRC